MIIQYQMIELYASARSRDIRDRERDMGSGMDVLDVFLSLCECLGDS
jgi:hypothetical protein